LRPRILIVPVLTELEWPIRPALEAWADVAWFDAPGVGSEPPPARHDYDAVVERGLAEVDRRGWDRYVVVGDEFGTIPACKLAAARVAAVAGLALGHACLGFDTDGERPVVNPDVMDAFERLVALDYRTHVRHMTQITQHAYDDEFAERYMERVSREVSLAYSGLERPALEPLMREVGAPLLLAKHEGCLAWTDESFEDVVGAFPEATRVATRAKPSASPEFAEALRSFCEELFAGVDEAPAGPTAR
jgi:hypothetical protein